MTGPFLLADGPTVGLKYFTTDQVLSPYVYVFYAAFIVSYLFTPVMRTVASYYGIIDVPDKLRKMHRQPVAYLGGIAVFMGWLCGLATTQMLGVHRVEIDLPQHVILNFSIVVGGCIIVLLGLWDDVLGLAPMKKIGGQIVAAAVLLYSGLGTHASMIFLAPMEGRLRIVFHNIPHFSANPHIVIATSGIFVTAIVIGCCNATNLLDGLDGLCGGVTGIIAFGLLFLAVNVAMKSGGMDSNADATRVVLGLALLGAVLGFVPFNFNPASIFMGDAGSMFLGYACAVMIILFAIDQYPKWFLAAMVVFALPILDTALAFGRRWVNKRPLFSADRRHFHHQLVARGFSIRKTVMISYGLALVFAMLGVAIVYMRTRYAVALYLVVFGSILVAAYKMGMVHEKMNAVVPKSIGMQSMEASTGVVDLDGVLEVKPREPEQTPVSGTGGWVDVE